MTEKKPIDWERVETDYRAGLLSLREIATAHGLTHGAINKRAKRDGWVRDLAAKIKAKADALVSKQAVSNSVSAAELATERQIVEANALEVAAVRMNQRLSFRRLSETLSRIRARLDDEGESLPLDKHIACSKQYAEALKISVGMEREAYGLGTGSDTESSTVFERIERVIVRPSIIVQN